MFIYRLRTSGGYISISRPSSICDSKRQSALRGFTPIGSISGGNGFQFAFVFIDASKNEYNAYCEACARLVQPGGLIAFDNMLQGGDVADRDKKSAAVAAIRTLNAKIAKDPRVDAVLLPVGDGMTLARRVR